MKKRKFAEGGYFDISGGVVEPFPDIPSDTPGTTFPMPVFPTPRPGGQGGGTARGGLDMVGQGAKTVSGALDDIQAKIGGGGGFGGNMPSPGMTMKKGGAVKGYAKGGMVGKASKRADGIAQRGKTRGKFI